MILQLKISLKHIGIPVWRRIQINEDCTFQKLHQTIQIAFGWTDTHLHNFEIRKSNGQKVDALYIEPSEQDEEELFPFYSFGDKRVIPEQSDEKNVHLSTWLQQEKDRILYTYDFGDNWEHDIVLEKILEPEADTIYPICVKAKNNAPIEDSRFEVMEDPSFLITPNGKKIVEIVNEKLSEME